MSKYPVQYVSGSKGAIDIEAMATPHLCNAWRKMVNAPFDNEDGRLIRAATCAAMGDELRFRGGTYDADTDQWNFPPKEAANV